MTLTTGEKEFMKFYRHFKYKAGDGLNSPSLVSAQNRHRLMSPSNWDKVGEWVEALEEKGLISKLEDEGDVAYRLTESGEVWLYGEFAAAESYKITFAKVLRHYQVTAGGTLLADDIAEVAPKYLNPVEVERLDEILQYALDNGFLVGVPKGYQLTEAGVF